MRLRVLVSAAGTPAAVSSDPIDVLENGVAGARWTVADAWPDMDEARTVLLRTLQARAGTPATPLRQVRVRLPRRLCGPRLHPSRTSVGGSGFDEVIRWLRGLPPSNYVNLARASVPVAWEYEFRGAGLGLPKPLPRRRRRPCPACAEMDGWGCQEHQRLPRGDMLNSEAVAREVGRVVSAAGAKASDVRVEGDRILFTATVERPLDEAPELPRLGPNDPNPTGVDPTPELMPIADVDLATAVFPRAQRIPVHTVRGRAGPTYIAAKTPERAQSLAARGYREIYEDPTGRIRRLPSYASEVVPAPLALPGSALRGGLETPALYDRTVVLDLTGGVPSIELPEFDLDAIVPVTWERLSANPYVLGYIVRLVDARGFGRDGRTAEIHRALGAWSTEGRDLNLRVETERHQAQVNCRGWRLRGELFILPVERAR